jgi:hypothetical protein
VYHYQFDGGRNIVEQEDTPSVVAHIRRREGKRKIHRGMGGRLQQRVEIRKGLLTIYMRDGRRRPGRMREARWRGNVPLSPANVASVRLTFLNGYARRRLKFIIAIAGEAFSRIQIPRKRLLRRNGLQLRIKRKPKRRKANQRREGRKKPRLKRIEGPGFLNSKWVSKRKGHDGDDQGR